MSRPIVKAERAEGILVLTIDREGSGNALSAETAAAISEAIAPIAAQGPSNAAGIRCVILTGAGSKFFCAGGDIKRYRALRTAEEVQSVFDGPRGLLDAIENLPVPVIAAINGYALGGGAELAQACDLRIASDTAQIGYPQTRLGIIPGFHGIARLARDIGHARAMKLLLTGERLTAAAALELGLVHEVVEPEELMSRAQAMARAFDACGPLALAGAKQMLHAVHRMPHADSRALADEVLQALWLSQDHREAEAAFEQKRPPVFKGL